MDPQGSFGGSQPNAFVSRLLKLALGLFVTTSDLPQLSPEQQNNINFGYDCAFDSPCRWSSTGNSLNHWMQAKGEPEKILWLAATGAVQTPKEPFALIELKGGGEPADSLTSDVIMCQDNNALLSFTYWTVGSADLEICLLDQHKQKFNCTGFLHSPVQPGKVALQIPANLNPFYISLIPNVESGILVLDDIRYETTFCSLTTMRPRKAIPSLKTMASQLPSFPAALIIQGTAMLTSDPLRCQTGSGSLLFRYWSNGDVLLQGCALAYGQESSQFQCAEEHGKNNIALNSTLAVFEFASSITEPFTLNIVPTWDENARNQYLIIDEIAYIGNCTSLPETSPTTPATTTTTEQTTVFTTK
uniref:MAM domain-containing protein n=1 Tax=Panagrolaimus sp. ES5 TaxID=591445 RepID=A0AC34G6I8_9BILA